MKRSLFALALMALAATAATFAAEADEQQIRQARAAMNKAMRQHDMTIMSSYMTERITWSGPAWRTVGKPAFEKNQKGNWDNRPDGTWDYNPSKIIPFDAWHWLSEEGTWVQNRKDADGPIELRGTYLAFWQQEPRGKWMLDAHLFVTTSCAPVERAFCKRDTRQPVTPAR